MKPFDTGDIGLLAENLDDIEQLRKASVNRLLALLRPVDKGGYGHAGGALVVVQQATFVTGLTCDALKAGGESESIPVELVEQFRVAKERGKQCCIEHSIVKNLEKAVKAHPLGPWISQQKGVGFKQAGRLLGRIGDPYWHSGQRDTGEVDKTGDPIIEPVNRPRTVSELWSYCGYGVNDGEAPRHRKGVQGNWNDAARMRAWNIAGSCLKAQGHYADVYYATREHYADAVHARDCVRCGPKGKPAKAGSPLSDGHKHARALRKVSKEFLKDIWLESKRLHEAAELPMAA